MTDPLSERYFEDLCTHAGIGVVGIDEMLQIRFCNSAAARLFGSEPGQLIGTPILTLVPEERRELADRQLERTLVAGESNDFEFRHRLPGRNPLNLAVTVSPVVVEGRGIKGASIWVRDITRQVELLRDVAQAQKMAALESMAGAVAHHFNNLLGGIVTAIDFAQSSEHPDAPRKALRTTSEALARMRTLSFSLLAFAEGDHSDTVRGNLADIVRRHAENLTPTLDHHSIELQSDIQAIEAQAPVKPLLTVLGCLTTNAIEAMPEGGTLGLELHPGPQGMACLRIIDSGPGVREEYLPRLFEPFFTTKSPDRGRSSDHTGLGLAVVHGIVHDLGGTVTLQNSPTGTICTVVLPASDALQSP